MGFWHTGYLEFHEPVGYGDLLDHRSKRPLVYRCSFCEAVFVHREVLQEHLDEMHPRTRPLLFVNGKEIGGAPQIILEKLGKDLVEVRNCKSAMVNGKTIPIDNLSETLSNIDFDSVDITLDNNGITATFRLEYRIANEHDLQGVEQCFERFAKTGVLNVQAVEGFIADANGHKSAGQYLDGLCEYLYGVMAKEGSKGIIIPREMYRGKFNGAAESLKLLRRPLAITICALISFHYNHFSDVLALSTDSRVGIAAKRYWQWCESPVNGISFAADNLVANNYERLLTDSQTEQILQWSTMSFQDLQKSIHYIDEYLKVDMYDYDRQKLRILLTDGYSKLGDNVSSMKHARDLLNTTNYAVPAEMFIKNIKDAH